MKLLPQTISVHFQLTELYFSFHIFFTFYWRQMFREGALQRIASDMTEVATGRPICINSM